MTLGVCDSAWSLGEEKAALSLLAGEGIFSLGISPYRYFSDLGKAKTYQIRGLRDRLSSRGFRVDRLGDFFLGRPDLSLFAPGGALGFREHFLLVMDLAVKLKATYLVYSGPKTRLSSLGAQRTLERAVEEFDYLAWQAGRRGLTIGVMALPVSYGGNFLRTDAEVIRFLSAVRAPNLKWHADTGVMALTSSRVRESWLSHCGGLHVSEVGYSPMVGSWLGHVGVASHFKGSGLTPFLEMMPGSNGLGSLEKGIQFCRDLYF